MGKKKDNETRQRIVEAAMKLFREQGMDGMSMRELADAAGVNKGLLHYYFTSKSALFQEVFQQHITTLYSKLSIIVEQEGTLERKVEAMVHEYFIMLADAPSLPAFVIFEAQRDPGMIARSPMREVMLRVASSIEPELKKRKLPPERSSGLQFLLTMVSLCAFTFAMLPSLAKALKLGKTARQAMLQQRQQHIVSVLTKSLRP